MFTSGFRKTIGLFLLAFAIGVGISLVLPFWGWVAICAIAMAILLKEENIYENSNI